MTKNINLDFSGGLQLLFKEQKFIITIEDAENKFNINNLVNELKDKYLIKNPELFLGEDKKLRPGILVFINDADWELEGCEDYVINNNDRISFISTLHGG